MFSPKMGTKQEWPLWLFLFNIIASSFRQEKDINGIQIGKEEVQLPLSVDSMILYVENLKESTELLALIRVQQGCRIQDQCTKVNYIPVYCQWTIKMKL